MKGGFKDVAYTDTKNHVVWGFALGIIVTGLAAVSFIKGMHLGVGYLLLIAGVWMLATACWHTKNGMRAVMTLNDDGIDLGGGLFVRYEDIDKIWAGDPFPMNPMGRLNIVFHLNDRAEIVQTKRSVSLTLRTFLSLTTVGCNISMIRKKKSVSLMAPGLRPLDGTKQSEDDIIEELYARVDAAQID